MIAKIVVVALMTCDPALASLFTPGHAQLGRYEVCTTADPIEAVLAGGGLARPDTTIEALESLEAFGGARLVTTDRVWRACTAATACGSRGDGPTPTAASNCVTLLSPYPDASLTHLNPGTMVIRWTLQRSTQNSAEHADAKCSLRVQRVLRFNVVTP